MTLEVIVSQHREALTEEEKKALRICGIRAANNVRRTLAVPQAAGASWLGDDLDAAYASAEALDGMREIVGARREKLEQEEKYTLELQEEMIPELQELAIEVGVCVRALVLLRCCERALLSL